jgi:hypothetical protein
MATALKSKATNKKWERNRRHTTVTVDPDLWNEVEKRGRNWSKSLDKVLHRFKIVIGTVGAKMRDLFTDNEWATLIEAIPEVSADSLLSLQAWQLVEQEIIRREMTRRYKCDARRLINKLAGLDTLEIWILIDAIERWHLVNAAGRVTGVNPFKCEELA